MFLGLGVNVKFPADFSRAPYTVVACGTSLLPQKVTFPFSLIAPPSAVHPGISPAYNEIVPGWMLSDNYYALARAEAKFKARNKARRSRLDCAVLRPDTIELMRDACRRLEAVAIKETYTEQDVPGLGKNFLLERSRRQALEAYRFFVRLYALLGLKEQAMGEREPAALLAAPGQEPRWEHQRSILVGEFGIRDVAVGLGELAGLLETVGRSVEAARARDDRRGVRIIEDYGDAHPPAAEDAVVRNTWAEARQQQSEIVDLLRRWGNQGGPPGMTLSAPPLVSLFSSPSGSS
jgi:hypothetical protein